MSGLAQAFERNLLTTSTCIHNHLIANFQTVLGTADCHLQIWSVYFSNHNQVVTTCLL